jgi:dinuclear metal center YbgI/SA1388 family protein
MMQKKQHVIDWLDEYLCVNSFDDVSNNSLQIESEGDKVSLVAFGVDASVDFMNRAAQAGADMCVVHHDISWGGGIKRVTGAEYKIIKTAIDNNLSLYASHLPLDAHKTVGNNWNIAKYLRLKSVKEAFSYHGNVIGVVGVSQAKVSKKIGDTVITLEKGWKVGVCSGGAGSFAVDAKKLGCDIFITGEASWAEVIAAENVGMKMVCAGHYETETFGVKALALRMQKELKVKTVFICKETGRCKETGLCPEPRRGGE